MEKHAREKHSRGSNVHFKGWVFGTVALPSNAKIGCPNRLGLVGTRGDGLSVLPVDELGPKGLTSFRTSTPLSSSLVPGRLPISSMMLAGLGFAGAIVLTVAVIGRGCREQTSRASTPADLRRAQKSCDPTSRDPLSVTANARKSDFPNIGSISSGRLNYAQMHKSDLVFHVRDVSQEHSAGLDHKLSSPNIHLSRPLCAQPSKVVACPSQ